ncbi:MAG: lytic transglycosylase domain-containing protein [Synergistaceae bacterium]|jgi:soluble lytic murein transglycosylase|nr:lytic transglycosylase domain-containing protein [Synergistaceae bacterium]
MFYISSRWKLCQKKSSILSAAVLALLVTVSLPDLALGSSLMERSFRAHDWAGLERAYQSASDDIVKWTPDYSPPARVLTTRDLSLYANGLWRQGRYEEGVSVLETISPDFPEELKPYANIMLVMGMERTDRKSDALGLGVSMWEQSPQPIRYYLAYAIGRLTRDLDMPEESLTWFRRMFDSAADKKRRLQALLPMIDLEGATGDDAANLLIELPSHARALEICRSHAGSGSRVEYALGYNAYVNKRYSEAIPHFNLASADVSYGEAARYYQAWSAYRAMRDNDAFKLWSDIALSGFDYPQRSVRRLADMSERSRKQDIIALLKSVASRRKDDYPELAADALVALAEIADGKTAENAEKELYSSFHDTNQAAASRWDKGWRAWKSSNYKAAYDHWNAGYSKSITNRELASRILYWQTRALERLNSPVAAERVTASLLNNHPGEYHAFLVSADGGIRSTPPPEAYSRRNNLEEWGFVTYARLENAVSGDERPDAEAVYRSIRLALWEGDFGTGARMFESARRRLPGEEYSSTELFMGGFPKAFEPEVTSASQKTGVDRSIIWGIMRQESMYEPDVTSSAGAYGLMQLMPATGREEARKANLPPDSYRQPATNIQLGTNHIAGLIARFKDLPRSLAAYNAGGTPVTRWSQKPIDDVAEWIEDIAYSETRGYVKAVLRNMNVYRLLYGDQK